MHNTRELMELCAIIEGFLTSLRMGDGMQEENVEKLCSALRHVAELYRASPMVPKRLAFYLVELDSQMIVQADAYPKPERDRIYKASDRVGELIRNSVLSFEK
ncbi:MAG: hypothetical protein NTW87_13425 [Planctomycetota bacterium]|nr:hypothetical protein [Planctomycetota bacterium]